MLEFDNLTKLQKEFFLEFIWNGVGSREFAKPPQLIFANASVYHDFAYFRGGNESDRKIADKDFFHRSHSSTRKQHTYTRPFYYVMSYVYFYGLKKIGGKAWEYYDAPAQNWKEFLDHVYAYFDRSPNMKGRPPEYNTWLRNRK